LNVTSTPSLSEPTHIFYGWWIVVAAFLNLFFTVGIVYYGFPVFYPSLVESMGFTRAQLIQGFLIGFVVSGLLLGFLAGVLIDRLGARSVIRAGIGFVGLSLILMGSMTRLWQYYALCLTEVVGYVLAGPIPNQVLVSSWFRVRRGRAMGYAYLGLGLGGVASPLLISLLIHGLGWRRAFQIIGALTLAILFPIAQWVTRSAPGELGLSPDGLPTMPDGKAQHPQANVEEPKFEIGSALRTGNFWLIVAGCTFTIGAIGAVTQHFVLFLKDQGYSLGRASRASSGMLVASLAGRIVVGYVADRYSKKNVMALFYLLLALAIPMLFLARSLEAVWGFAAIFGFAMGADYMLIPLVTAECFGLANLGKLLALIITAYSVGQWLAPWLAGRVFDVSHSYNAAWIAVTVTGLAGAATIYAISTRREPASSMPEHRSRQRHEEGAEG
jgi:MFS family permease